MRAEQTRKALVRQPFADRARLRGVKREAVLQAAVELFLQVGYHRATLTEVARRLGITKPALYTYFPNKEEILVECYRLGFESIKSTMREIEAQGGTGADKLRTLMRRYAIHMMSDFGRGLVAFDDRELTGRAHDRVRADKRRIDSSFRRLLEEGTADGSLAPGNVKLAAFTIAGALSWICQWYDPRGRASAEEIADDMVNRLIHGMRGATQDRRRRPGGSR